MGYKNFILQQGIWWGLKIDKKNIGKHCSNRYRYSKNIEIFGHILRGVLRRRCSRLNSDKCSRRKISKRFHISQQYSSLDYSNRFYQRELWYMVKYIEFVCPRRVLLIDKVSAKINFLNERWIIGAYRTQIQFICSLFIDWRTKKGFKFIN